MRIVRLVVFGLLAPILLAATSSPVGVVHDVVHKVALTGGVNSAPVSVIGKAALVGPANSTSISVISRSVLGGPIEDLVSAVIAAARGTSRNVLEVCPGGCAYSTIQDAIDAASDGDEILVRPGTYTGSDGVQNPMAKLLNKSVWLHSSDGPEATVFSGSNARVVFDCRGSQSSDTVIEGFTFANGYGVPATTGNAGGLHLYDYASISVINCIFKDNYAHYGGGVNAAQYSQPSFESCQFINNEAHEKGGGARLPQGGDFTNCTFVGNHARYGGGLSCGNPTQIIGCSFTDNTAIEGTPYSCGGGIHGGNPEIGSTLMCDNMPGGNICGPWTDLGGNTIQETCPLLGTCCVSECGISVACYDDESEQDCLDLGGEWNEGAICSDINCGPVQWTDEEGGNGHWYQAVLNPEGVETTWTEAAEDAENIGGHLVVFSDGHCNPEQDCELAYINSLFGINSQPDLWSSWGNDGPYVGVFQDLQADDYEEPGGGWTTVTDEPLDPDLWRDGQPNDGSCQPNANHAHLTPSSTTSAGTLNDLNETDTCDEGPISYIIEWSADIASPTGCEPDGIVDYGQILDGTLADVDCNGIPDICQPPDDTGACCIQGVCIDGYEAQDCLDSYGFFYEDQACADIECQTVFSVDDDSLDDPEADFNDIQDAINHSGPDFVINVQPGTYTGTGDNIITLPAHGISIIGVPGSTIIDGEGARRGLIGEGCGDNDTVIDGLSFENGLASEGAGAYLYQCNPEIINCKFEGNWADLHPGNGGGLCLRESDPIVTNCLFVYNYALGYGGGMLSNQDSNPIVTGCTFEFNEADGLQGDGTGGGFHCSSGGEEYGGSAVLTDCVFIGNRAKNQQGGGVSAWPGVEITLTNCTITHNDAYKDGGGLYVKDSTATLTGCTFTSNSSGMGAGGGLYTYESTSTLNNCDFSDNTAQKGGGLHNDYFSTMTLSACIFTDNNSTEEGGGIKSISSELLLTDCTIQTNSAGTFGGGIQWGDTEPSLTNTVVCGNTPDQIYPDSWIDLGTNTIRNNCDYWVVDDLFDDDPNADFDNIQEAVDAASDGDEILVMPGTYSDNDGQAVVNPGGKNVYLHSLPGEKATTRIEGGDIRGVLLVSGESFECIIEGFTITNCGTSGYSFQGADGCGTGILTKDSNGTIRNCDFLNMSAYHGGGIATYSSDIRLEDCLFSGNTAQERGGAVFLSTGSYTMTGCTATDNTAIRGGGIHIGGPADYADLQLINCNIFSNTATDPDWGGGLHMTRAGDPPSWPGTTSATISNSTIRDNTGHGIRNEEHYQDHETLTVSETIICGNTTSQIYGPYTEEGTGNSITDECIPDDGFGACCIQGVCIDDYEAQDCSDAYGFFYNQQFCTDVICETVFSVDDDLLDDPEADFNDIQDAINHSGPDFVINVQPGTYTGTGDNIITLPAHGISIIGVPGSTIIDGQGQRRGLIGDGCGDNGTVIQGLTFSNCWTDGDGGGIYLNDCSPTITNCTIENNSAVLSGGGIYCQFNSNATIDNCSILDNTAVQAGGGIGCHSSSNTTITDCTIENNSAGGGGGISTASNSNQTITGCVIRDNMATGGGGGGISIYDGSSYAEIASSTICGNTPNQIDGDYNDNGGNTIRNNCDYWVVDDDGLDDPDADFDNIQEAVNAASDGDEIIVMPGTYTGTGEHVIDLNVNTLIIRGSADPTTGLPLTFVDGEDARGCLFCWEGSNDGSLFENIEFTNGNSGAGGSVQLLNVVDMHFNNCVFSNSHASGDTLEGNGGGMYCHEATVSLADCTFTGNLADHSGGALWIDGSDMTLVNTDFIDNVAIRPGGGSDGGGMFLYGRDSSASAILENCTFANNYADLGGGISADPYGDEQPLLLVLSNCTFDSNIAEGEGGGARLYNTNASITECRFTNNRAYGDPGELHHGGGGLRAILGDVVIGDSTFCLNTPDQIRGDYTNNGGNYIADECLPDGDNGACCVPTFPEATCISNISEEECTDQEGTFYRGATCEETTCSAVGACCYEGNCDITFEADCSGQWHLDTDCSTGFCDIGACCYSDLTCLETTAQECTGTFTPDVTCDEVQCQPDPGFGACCIGTTCSDNVAEGDCIGDWYDSTLCSDTECVTGACCLPDLTCIDGVTGSKCDGAFYQDLTCSEVICTPPTGFGACCTGDTCTDNVAQDDCAGDWYKQTLCSDVDCITGACCYQDLTCVDGITDSKCDGLFTPNATCAETLCHPYAGYGACCTVDGCQDNVAFEDCDGDFYEGDLCFEIDCITGVCCLPDLTCIDGVTSDKCDGVFYQDLACSEVTCLPIPGYGACCTSDWTCNENVLETDCDGTWYEQALCSQITCVEPDPTGACCLDTGNCVPDVTESICTAFGGVEWNEDLDCTQVDCSLRGACCLPDGSCIENLTLAKCDASSGDWNQDLTCKEANCPQPDPVWACCLTNGDCVDATQTKCTTFGGEWNDGLDCTQVDCSLRGACCLPDGSCIENLTLAKCDANGGDWNQDLTCKQADCPQPDPVWACCLTNGDCVDATQTKCTTFGGEWNDGLDCTQVDCSLRGACCYPDGSCSENLTEAKCDAQNGNWHQDLTCPQADCPQPDPTGACCLSSGGCVQSTEATCTDFEGKGWYSGEDCSQVDCSIATGACCVDGVTCYDTLTLSNCVSIGGKWTMATSCTSIDCEPTTGACCFGGVYCVENIEQDDCSGTDSYWVGGASCTDQELEKCIDDGEPVETGACCFDGETCYDGFPELACTGNGGTWFGVDSTCSINAPDCQPIIGACCTLEGLCIDGTSAANCNNYGGQWNGPGSECIDVDCTKACCFENDGWQDCENLAKEDCQLIDGTWHEDQVCDPNGDGQADDSPCAPFGACCLPGEDSCVNTTEATCQGSGYWFEGEDCILGPPCDDVVFVIEGSCIQESIDIAADGDIVVVEAGTYDGSECDSENPNSIIDPKGKDIRIVSLSGAELTILVGDNDGNAIPRGIFCHLGEGSSTLIEGFTIRNFGQVASGHGIKCISSTTHPDTSPTIRNCIFEGNRRNGIGSAALIAVEGTNPEFYNCIFRNNGGTGGGDGGAVACTTGCSPLFSNCTFENNRDNRDGGGALLIGNILPYEGSHPRLINCTFEGNECNLNNGKGGAVYITGLSIPLGNVPQFTNCMFRENNAYQGGALWDAAGDDFVPYLDSCQFLQNSATNKGGAMSLDDHPYNVGDLTNSYFCGNMAPAFPHIAEYSGTDLQHLVDDHGCIFEDECDLPVEGACCYPGGGCIQQTSEECNGWAWHEDVDCSEVDCTPPDLTGACCLLDGSCIDEQTEDECFTQSGQWEADTDCSSVECPQPPTGACCTDGDCTIVTEANCPGEYQGDDTACEADTCQECTGDYDGSGNTSVEDLLFVIAGWGNPYDVNDLLAVIADWGCGTAP